MNGGTVSRALRDRFEAIRRSGIVRLDKKSHHFNHSDRMLIETITIDVVHVIARLPARALMEDVPKPTLEAVARLFALGDA